MGEKKTDAIVSETGYLRMLDPKGTMRECSENIEKGCLNTDWKQMIRIGVRAIMVENRLV